MSLDDELAAWAAAVRLPEAEAEAIFRRIAAAPVVAAAAASPALDPAWWRHFTADFAERMTASSRPARRAA